MPRSFDQPPPRPSRKLLASPLLWVAAVYLSLFFVFSNGFWINDNGLKFLQVQAIEASEYRDFAIPWPGREINPNFKFSAVRPPFAQISDQRLYASYPPFFALVSSIPHQLFGFQGLFLLPLLGALLTLGAVRRLAALLGPDADSARYNGKVAVALVAFAGPVWFYSFTFWEHTLALALSCWSFVACIEYRQDPGQRAAARVGILAGLAIYFRTDAYLLAAVSALVCVTGERRRLRGAVTLGLTLLATLVPLWVFQWTTTQHPFGLHIQSQGWSDITFAAYLEQRSAVVENLFFNTHGGFWRSLFIVLPFLLAAPLCWIKRSRATPSADGASVLWEIVGVALLILAIAGGAIALQGHLAARAPMSWLLVANGLFSVSPILILAFLPAWLPGPPEPAPRPISDTARSTLRWVLFCHVVLYAAMVPRLNSTGIHWGCRFLLIAYPILAVLAAPRIVEAFRHTGRRRYFHRALVAAAFVLSVASQLYSIDLLRTRREFVDRLATEVSKTEGDFIITELWHLPQDLARVFYDRPIFLAGSKSDSIAIINRARDLGKKSVLLIQHEKLRMRRSGDDTLVSDRKLRFSPVLLQVRSIVRDSNERLQGDDPDAR